MRVLEGEQNKAQTLRGLLASPRQRRGVKVGEEQNLIAGVTLDGWPEGERAGLESEYTFER